MQARENDTIVAISTPLGEGGIGIVRLSGPRSLQIADRLFQPTRSSKPSSLPSHTLHHGYIVDPEQGERIDEVLLSIMRSPHSYTTEDVVEINGHGGLVPLLRILEAASKEGARLATPGEFTKRAFLGGRIDLAQAEAVIEIIRSKSERGLALAMRHLDGSLSRRIGGLRDRLLSFLAEAEAAVDFPEEGLEILSPQAMARELEATERDMEGLRSGFREGRFYQEGIATALIGRSNVGKSSLFNALLQKERAIVTPCPGTTRDALEGTIDLQGLPFLLIDTAGMRSTEEGLDMAEREGMARGRAWLERADLLLIVIDGSETLTSEDRELLRQGDDRRRLVVISKGDLPPRVKAEELATLVPGISSLVVSARTGLGLEALKEAMFQAMAQEGLDMTQDLVITNLSHRQALEEASLALFRGREALTQGLSPEFLSLDLREALDALGRITGETTSEDVLEAIFSRFCIGK